jgi:Xaa-Pro dipeptidase
MPELRGCVFYSLLDRGAAGRDARCVRRRAFMAGAPAGLLAWAGCRTDRSAASPADMDERDAFAPLAGLLDGVRAPDASEHGVHVARVQQRLRELEIGALVVESGPAMQYLSGVRWGRSERPLLLVVPAEGAVAWVCPAFELRRAREQIGTPVEVLTWEEHRSPYARVSQILIERELAGELVAVDTDARTFVTLGLADALGRDLLELGTPVVATCRMTKTSLELELLRRANEATKLALAAAARELRIGMRQSELAALVRRAQETAGLEQVWVLTLFGPAAAFPHGTAEDRALGPGEMVLVDTGGSLHGYRSDITRSWLPFGEPTEEMRRGWETVRRAQIEAMKAIRPGVACGEVDAQARAVMASAGYGSGYDLFTHRLGHGIGLEVHEPPYLVRDSPLVLEPGMTMSNEPGLYFPGDYGVRIEDIVAVTEDGVEVFGPVAGPFEDPFAGHDL